MIACHVLLDWSAIRFIHHSVRLKYPPDLLAYTPPLTLADKRNYRVERWKVSGHPLTAV